MSLAKQHILTIGDLVRIALGGEELTDERLQVLQNLFLVLLRKLDCHNETVKIKGLAAKSLQRLLSDCPTSCQYNFQFENVELFEKKYHLLEELERKTQEIEAKLKQHFQQIRSRSRTNIFAADKWHIYASPTEDLGALCFKADRKYWFLAENSVFNTELRKRVVPQVVAKLKKFEDTIASMQSQLCEIAQMADKLTKKLNCVEAIIKDIEDLRATVNTGEKVFRDAIAEVDEMLSCKLHRVTVPALKIYLEKRFDDAKTHLRILQFETKYCPPTKPLPIEDKKTCLSCCHHQDPAVVKNFKNLKSIDENIKCSCCNFLKDSSLAEKIERMRSLDLSALNPYSDRKNGQCEDDSDSRNVLKSISQQRGNKKTCKREKESVQRRKVLEFGPYA